MNLSLAQDDPLNTLFFQHDGRPVYHVDTPFRIFKARVTSIFRVDGPTRVEVAQIRWRGRIELTVRGRAVQLEKSGFFSNSEIFQASDRRQYKWKIEGSHPWLVRNDSSKATIAVYKPPSSIFSLSSRPASLNITPDGLPILDDIVATYVYVKHRQRQRHSNAQTINNNNMTINNMNAASVATPGGF